MNPDRRLLSLSMLSLFVAVACLGGGEDPPTGPDQASVCCECACAEDGIPCLNITLEGNEGDSCSDMCEVECAAHPECPSVGAIATCTLLPPDDPDGPPGAGPCSEILDDEIDGCDQPPPEQR